VGDDRLELRVGDAERPERLFNPLFNLLPDLGPLRREANRLRRRA